ncbi:MAG TPA: hypothetical protein VF503_16010 [Sphingobium sp.]|uniref:hypothetical protein n=1 Tax=Sphingobium sp. TaxID=1912891 RepID=UPI002ED18042
MFKSIIAGLAFSLVLATPQVAQAQRYETQKEHRDAKRKNSLIGAGLGLLGGAILSGGDPWATLGGAAAGGLVGNVTTKDKRIDRRWDDRRWDGRRRDDRDHRDDRRDRNRRW